MTYRNAQVLMTAFDTLLYYDVDTKQLRHDDVGRAPRNLRCEDENSNLKLVHYDEEQGRSILTEYVLEAAAWIDQYSIRLSGQTGTAQPSGIFTFSTTEVRSWEMLRVRHSSRLDGPRFWKPSSPEGGTELMVRALRHYLGSELDQINLHMNDFDGENRNGKPDVVWFHNEPGPSYEWCQEANLVEMVSRFVFVSNTQMVSFCQTYRLIPKARCRVIRNAIHVSEEIRPWPSHSSWRWKCVYVSAPYRGLHTLAKAWRRVQPQNAELHIFSGVTLWGRSDQDYRSLFAELMEMEGVVYHGVAPNDVIRNVLRDSHFLLYPARFDETSCISVVEAMSSGLRVIAPSRGALAETSGGFARIYPDVVEEQEHVELFAQVLTEELENPWLGRHDFAVAEQLYCKKMYDWKHRQDEWRHLINEISSL